MLSGLFPGACGEANDLAPNDGVNQKVSPLVPSGLRGFRIAAGGDNTFQVNAFGGAAEGSPVKLWQNCSADNPDCTWSYTNGMISSDRNRSLAIRSPDSPVDGSHVFLSASCLGPQPAASPCRWVYHDGRFYNEANPNLALYAAGGATTGSDLVLKRNCFNGVSGNCHWVIESAMIATVSSEASSTGDTLVFKALDGATDLSRVGLAPLNNRACTNHDPTCTWTFINGMMFNDGNRAFPVNAVGGAADGTPLWLNSACDVSNPDCRWRLQSGNLFSDMSNLAVTPSSTGNQLSLLAGSNTKLDVNFGGCGAMGQLSCDAVTCDNPNGTPLPDGYCHRFDAIQDDLSDGSIGEGANSFTVPGLDMERTNTPTLLSPYRYTFSARNFGTTPVDIDTAQITFRYSSGATFQWTSPAPFTIAPGTTFSQVVTAPAAGGVYTFDLYYPLL